MQTNSTRRGPKFCNSESPQPHRLQLCQNGSDIQHGECIGATHSDANLSKSELVTKIKARLESVDPLKAKELGGVFLFNIFKGTSVYSWTLDLNKVTVYEGEPEDDPDTTFTLNEHNFKQLVTGREDPRVIMQAGRCSVTGDIMRAMKLEPYIKLN
nr:peroxisomal multifunctional enzyme A-like [Maniola hyperantus]